MTLFFSEDTSDMNLYRSVQGVAFMTPAEKAASKLCDIWRGHYSSAAVTRIIDEAITEQQHERLGDAGERMGTIAALRHQLAAAKELEAK